jgi:acyl-CoA thioester hydrolase
MGNRRKHEQSFNCRIDWSDLDLLGHVNNIAISRYVQAARVEYCGRVGLDVYPGMTTGPILAASRVQFLSQLFFPGNVRILTRCKKAGSTSIVMEHALYSDDGTLCAVAEDVVVRYDFAAKTKIPLGDAIRDKLAAYEASCDGEFPELPDRA